MIRPSLAPLTALVAILGGCNGHSSLGELEGSYSLDGVAEHVGSRELVACNLEVDRHGGVARCERTSATSHVFREDLTIDIGFEKDAIDATIVYVQERSSAPGGGCYVETCTTTIDGEADRSERRDVERGEMFEAVAGEWEGGVLAEHHCVAVLEPDASDSCSSLVPEETLEISTTTFAASVFGKFATVEWVQDESTGSFDVLGRDDGIEVDGVAVPKS